MPATRMIIGLGFAQIVSWGSIFYSLGFLMIEYRQALGVEREQITGAFAVALVISALLSTPVGTSIDRRGGRGLMISGSLIIAVLLSLLSQVREAGQLFVLYALLGVPMAFVLYDPAFAVLTREFRGQARRAITMLTFIGGMAATVFWPLTQWLIAHLGWRSTLVALAAMNLLIALPLHAWLIPRRSSGAAPASPMPTAATATATAKPVSTAGGTTLRQALRDPAFLLLMVAFAMHALAFFAISIHLMSILQDKGVAPATAALIGAVIGPTQVAGRACEFAFAGRTPILGVGVLALSILTGSLLMLAWLPPELAALLAFSTLYGAANGVMTIVRGNTAVTLYGDRNYGRINGALVAPTLLANAAGPLVASWLTIELGGYRGTLTVLAIGTALGTVLMWIGMRLASRRHRG